MNPHRKSDTNAEQRPGLPGTLPNKANGRRPITPGVSSQTHMLLTMCPSYNYNPHVLRASKIGFGKYIRLEEMGTLGGATGADPREK
jgi:hypothetical protein